MYVYIICKIFFHSIYLFLFFLGPIYISSFPQSIYFVFFFLFIFDNALSFLRVRHGISFCFDLWGTYLYLFLTYLVTNILHVTVFSSQICLFLFKQTHWNLRSWSLPKKLATFLKTFNILYHGLRSVIVRHSSKFFFLWIFSFAYLFWFFSLALISV